MERDGFTLLPREFRERTFTGQEVIQVMKLRGILDGSVIRLRGAVNLPAGTEVDVTIEPSRAEGEVERRQRVARRILERQPIDIRPLTTRDLIEEGREE